MFRDGEESQLGDCDYDDDEGWRWWNSGSWSKSLHFLFTCISMACLPTSVVLLSVTVQFQSKLGGTNAVLLFIDNEIHSRYLGGKRYQPSQAP